MKTLNHRPPRGQPIASRSDAKSLALLGGLLALSALGPAPTWAAAEPLTACTAEPTNMTITFGDLVDCKIDVGSDSDLFRFAGAANSQVVVTLLNRNAYFCQWEGRCPEADILNPDLSVLATLAAGDYANSRLLTLPVSGTYTIRVRDDNSSETSSYRVGLERLFPTSTTAVHTLIDTDNPDTIDPVLNTFAKNQAAFA